jgi:hypothetical protein
VMEPGEVRRCQSSPHTLTRTTLRIESARSHSATCCQTNDRSSGRIKGLHHLEVTEFEGAGALSLRWEVGADRLGLH